MKTLKEKWYIFGNVALGPGSVIFSILTLAGLIVAYIFKTNLLFSTLLSILSSFFAGFAGSFIKDDYEKIVGQNILEKKGRSALRNLQGISTQLCNVKIWVGDFLKKTKKQEDKNVLEEISRHISTIELNIASGLEDWVDIVPELKEKSLQGAEIDKKYREAVQSVVVQLLESRKELAGAKDEKLEQELKKKITDLEKQVKEIKKERSETFAGINISPSRFSNSALKIGSQNNVFSAFGSQICLRCGRSFTPNYLGASPLQIYGSNYCENCQKDMGSGLSAITDYGKN